MGIACNYSVQKMLPCDMVFKSLKAMYIYETIILPAYVVLLGCDAVWTRR
jgi:hypothetical protein